MKLPGQLGRLDFSSWGYGLVAAFIGGGSGAFSAGIATIMVDPHDFNIYTLKFWQVILGTFVIGGIVPFFAFLHNQPLPTPVKEVETVVKTFEEDPKRITTVKETHQEPIETDK